MKKQLHHLAARYICLAAIIILSANVNGQIPNWNFESWNTHTKDVPAQWATFGNTTKVSPGVSGQYAVKMQADSATGPGAVLYGTPGENDQLLGGTPFTARPDSMIAYFKYDIAPGDSAWVLLLFKKNGQNISNDFYQFTGSNTTGFERKAFKIHYTSGVTPDTVFIGFTSTIPNGNGPFNTNSYVILDNVSFAGTSQNVPNPDFESWTTQVITTPVGWESELSPQGNAVERTSDAYAENYALKLRTIFTTNGDTISGYTQTYKAGNNSWGPVFPVNSRPNSLKGFYKYIPENGDTFRISIDLFKNGQQVARGEFISALTVNAYTPFTAPINYFNLPAGNADSATIGISTFMMSQYSTRARGQSVAYIDNLSFDQFIYSGTEDLSEKDPLLLYPNPAGNNLLIRFPVQQDEQLSISMINMNGETVAVRSEHTEVNGTFEMNIDTSVLPAGVYMVRLQSGSNLSSSRVVIAK